jgi:hypothetical protein
MVRKVVGNYLTEKLVRDIDSFTGVDSKVVFLLDWLWDSFLKWVAQDLQDVEVYECC